MTLSLPLILICGDSLLLAGLETSLRRATGVRVQTLKTLKVSETFRVFEGVLADGVLLYDLAETDLPQLAGWLTDCPGLTLLGLDAEHDRIHILTGHSQAVQAVGDLTRVVLETAVGRHGDKVMG